MYVIVFRKYMEDATVHDICVKTCGLQTSTVTEIFKEKLERVRKVPNADDYKDGKDASLLLLLFYQFDCYRRVLPTYCFGSIGKHNIAQQSIETHNAQLSS